MGILIRNILCDITEMFLDTYYYSEKNPPIQTQCIEEF